MITSYIYFNILVSLTTNHLSMFADFLPLDHGMMLLFVSLSTTNSKAKKIEAAKAEGSKVRLGSNVIEGII